MKNLQVYTDFDGTITLEDTLNKFLAVHAPAKWLEYEKDWQELRIGSKECLKKQLNLITDVSKADIDSFLDNIQIDETFVGFYKFVKANNIKIVVVSDGLDYFIRRVLERFGIKDAEIYANKFVIRDNYLDVEFPHTNKDCNSAAGMCKCSVLKKYKDNETVILYAGDGRSDFCAAKNSDILFAKRRLLDYYSKGNKCVQMIEVLNLENFNLIEKYIEREWL